MISEVEKRVSPSAVHEMRPGLDDGGQKDDSGGQQSDAVGVIGCFRGRRRMTLGRDIRILDP